MGPSNEEWKFIGRLLVGGLLAGALVLIAIGVAGDELWRHYHG